MSGPGTSLLATMARPQPPQDVTWFPLSAPGAAETAPAERETQLLSLGCSAGGHHGVTFMGHPPWPGPGAAQLGSQVIFLLKDPIFGAPAQLENTCRLARRHVEQCAAPGHP